MNASPGKDADEGDEDSRRTLINLIAAVAVLIIAIGAVWAFKSLDEQRKLQHCIDSGRKDCVELVP